MIVLTFTTKVHLEHGVDAEKLVELKDTLLVALRTIAQDNIEALEIDASPLGVTVVPR